MNVRLIGARGATLATVIAMTASSLPGTALADSAIPSAPPSAGVTLELQTVNGSGCPAGSATAGMRPGNTGFWITYRDFRAEDGGDARATDIRKNCQVNLLVHVPQGFTFAVARADYWGRANLEPGAVALHRTNYYYQGSAENNYADHILSGPLRGGWRTTDITAAAELVWAPCGLTRSVNINTELRVNAGDSADRKSFISMRASDGDVYTLVQFNWQKC